MSVKSPVSDEVFEKFLNKTTAKKLEKSFGLKGVKFEKSNISTAESVENVVKSAVFFFRSEFSPDKASKTYEEQEVDQNKLSKIKFYDFPKNVNQLDWKGKETVPMYNSIEEINCKNCGGMGYNSCKKCGGSGLVQCGKCDGSGQVQCKKCKGSGKMSFNIEVLVESKKDKKLLTYNCGECFGSGQVLCQSCKGIGKGLCNKCKQDFGKLFCKDCKGTGKNYKYKIESVPFKVPKEQFIPHLFFKSEFEKKIGEEISEIITTVDGIYIKSLKDMDDDFVKAQLGYFDGDIKDRMNNAKKLFQSLQKSKGPESPKFPIYLFPVLKLVVKPESGKSFNVYSIGTERGYAVFAPSF
ncbi:MAG: hypothetical protein HWN67_22425 [Candidatus Helarchaeota archaeon]|nr:hypothetical protein [Candidatus Helarchaeota archaeon]